MLICGPKNPPEGVFILYPFWIGPLGVWMFPIGSLGVCIFVDVFELIAENSKDTQYDHEHRNWTKLAFLVLLS